ncbi:hypothetical protein PENSPDRAFT_14106 [Peniophora sp. CONT]|nr:hypothetical protein PENSPDRAFT_14106 [Peniophora sp. CONT]
MSLPSRSRSHSVKASRLLERSKRCTHGSSAQFLLAGSTQLSIATASLARVGSYFAFSAIGYTVRTLPRSARPQQQLVVYIQLDYGRLSHPRPAFHRESAASSAMDQAQVHRLTPRFRTPTRGGSTLRSDVSSVSAPAHRASSRPSSRVNDARLRSPSGPLPTALAKWPNVLRFRTMSSRPPTAPPAAL